MARRLYRSSEDLTFTSDDDGPSEPDSRGWQTEEFGCDQDSRIFCRIHWSVPLKKTFQQYFCRDLLGSSPTLKELISRMEKTRESN